MKKKLVFHFYFGKDWKNNQSVYIHLACLKHYCHVFDKINIIICVDEIENKEFINDIKHTINEYIDGNDITFSVRKNTIYRECRTFYDEVLNGENFDGIVFFGHSKGYTNITNEFAIKENIKDWILGLYYLSLEFVDEVEKKLSINGDGLGELNTGAFYGSFLSVYENYDDITLRPYAGTFYWINVNCIKNNNIKIPILDNRVYSEKFPYYMKDLGITSHRNYRYYYNNAAFYYNEANKYQIKEIIEGNCTNEEFNNFIKFKEEILGNEKVN